MILWLQENLGTIVISLFLLVLIVAIILKIVKDKRNGKSSCGGSCSGCAMSGMCHRENKLM
ncbi:MAG: FeoB-associated Cys-rich membrane protein [Oscillospiraceae bacterium]|nr:FeoB-associated Cys-rich membrane protein [Oscillospiraceae bacterium]